MATLLRYLTRFLPEALLAITALLLVCSAINLYEWHNERRLNRAFDDRTLVKETPHPSDHLHAYSIGYLHAKQGNFRGFPDLAVGEAVF